MDLGLDQPVPGQSLDAVFESASVAVIVTVWAATAVVGVPQPSRSSVPGQPGESIPVASKRRPARRPEVVYETSPLPPVLALPHDQNPIAQSPQRCTSPRLVRFHSLRRADGLRDSCFRRALSGWVH